MTRILGDDWLLPDLDDLNREWFTRGCICIQSCGGCDAVQHPPELICHACGASEFTWRESAGEVWARYVWSAAREALRKQLQIMDGTAFSLCLDNNMPIIVFDLFKPHNIRNVVLGKRVGTRVSA